MTDSRLIDSSIWLDYLSKGYYKEILESDEIFLLSVLSLFEIKKVMIKNKILDKKIEKSIDFIKKKSLVIPINNFLAEKAVKISIEKNMATVDSIIYTSAIENDATLITSDNDFRDLKNVIVLNKE